MISVSLDIHGKQYGKGASVLGEIRETVMAGKITAMIGPSGCGKSTLLNMVAGLESSKGGEIQFGCNGNMSPRIGYIFQTPRLMPWLTVMENMELICGKGNPNITGVLDAMGVLDKQGAFPAQLSGGMQRRVSVARAFVYQPGLLLLDEPFTSLDAPTADQLRHLLLNIWHQQQTTMVFVTHDLREAISLADEIWFLSYSPAKVIHKLSIDQPPARLLGEENGRQRIDEIAGSLLEQYPRILSGAIN